MKIDRYTKFEDLPNILIPQEVADYLGLNVDTVRRYIRTGEIRAIRQGKYYRLKKAWLMEYLDRQSYL